MAARAQEEWEVIVERVRSQERLAQARQGFDADEKDLLVAQVGLFLKAASNKGWTNLGVEAEAMFVTYERITQNARRAEEARQT